MTRRLLPNHTLWLYVPLALATVLSVAAVAACAILRIEVPPALSTLAGMLSMALADRLPGSRATPGPGPAPAPPAHP